jgi:hypothetical protein
MFSLKGEVRKITTLFVILVIILSGTYFLNNQSNISTESRSKAAITSSLNTVEISFSNTYIPLYNKDTFTVDILFNSPKPISSAQIYLNYSQERLLLDTVASSSVSTECQSRNKNTHILDLTLAVIDKGGIINLAKGTMVEDAQLPSGIFCFATLVFTIKSPTPSFVESSNFNFYTDNFSEWSISSNEQKLIPNIVGIPMNSSPYFFFCVHNSIGDATCDNKIDIYDFERFRQDFMRYSKVKLVDSTYITSDFDRDVRIDVGDFEIFRSGFIKNKFLLLR